MTDREARAIREARDRFRSMLHWACSNRLTEKDLREWGAADDPELKEACLDAGRSVYRIHATGDRRQAWATAADLAATFAEAWADKLGPEDHGNIDEVINSIPR
jgi:hypothetical protein